MGIIDHPPGSCRHQDCDQCREFRAYQEATPAERRAVIDDDPEVWSICKCGNDMEGSPQDLENVPCPYCKRWGCYTEAEPDPSDLRKERLEREEHLKRKA